MEDGDEKKARIVNEGSIETALKVQPNNPKNIVKKILRRNIWR